MHTVFKETPLEKYEIGFSLKLELCAEEMKTQILCVNSLCLSDCEAQREFLRHSLCWSIPPQNAFRTAFHDIKLHLRGKSKSVFTSRRVVNIGGSKKTWPFRLSPKNDWGVLCDAMAAPGY
jgi:hypothetical protein